MAIKKASANAPAAFQAPDAAPSGALQKQPAEGASAEQALKAAEHKYQQIFHYDSNGIRIINKDHSIYFINRSFSEISGVSLEEAVGRKCWEIFTSQSCHTPKCRLSRVLNGEEMVNEEIQRTKRDGAQIPCVITAYPLRDPDGRIVGIIEIFRDITDRVKAEEKLKQSEDRYRSLFEHAPVAIWEMDYSECKRYIDSLRAQGITDVLSFFDAHPQALVQAFRLLRTIDVNNANVQMNGAASKDDLVNNVNDALSHNHKALMEFAHNTLSLIDGTPRLIYEEASPEADGKPKRYRLVQVSVAPGCENSLSRVFFSMIDITDRKIAEQELTRYKDRLEDMVGERTAQLKGEIERRKETEAKLHEMYETERRLYTEVNRQMQDRVEFSRVLVHELKTPLTPIVSSSDYMVSHIADEPLKSFARQINRGALNLSNRIDELLDMSKGEVGLLSLKWRKINVQELLQECRASFEPLARERGIELSLDIPQTLPSAHADGGRVHQVIYNLLNNAMKNTPGGGKVIIRGSLWNDKILVEICDTGCGISPKDCKYLFQPYRRLHVNKDKRLGGLGLGLSICKMLVELHGEKIWYDTAVGQGSTFRFTLALYPARKTAGKKKA